MSQRANQPATDRTTGWICGAGAVCAAGLVVFAVIYVTLCQYLVVSWGRLGG